MTVKRASKRDVGGPSISGGDSITLQRVENELRLLRRAVESIELGVTLSDDRGRIVFTNPAEAQMHGYTVDELVGEEASRLAPEERRATIEIERLPMLTMWRRESVNRRKDGSIFPVQLVSDVLLDVHGRTSGLITCSLDITERKRAEEQILYRAYHDALTGLANRSLFNDRVAQALAQARRSAGILAVIYVDLDHFKAVNDEFGQSAGDGVLRILGERISRSLRDDDTVARIGGDEFTVLLPTLRDRGDASLVAQKILRRLARTFPFDGRSLAVTASAGMAVFPRDGRDAETLLRRADRALYRAKKDGRNTFREFDFIHDGEAGDTAALEVGLRQALSRNELILYYQPRFDLRAGRVTGCAALLRWNHPARGRLLPDAFVPAIERAGLADQIGTWALKAAAIQARDWRRSERGSVRIAVQISARQLWQPGFERTVERVLAEAGCVPELIEIELAESGPMRDVDAAARLLGGLAHLGVSLAIGDCGASPSAIACLRRLPFNTLKVDRAAVRHVHEQPDDRAMARAIIDMAHSFGATVVAEGVDSEPQRSALFDLGCDAAQGELFGEPVLADAFPAVLA